ncbi:NADPH:quinone reductase-like Zn-dependent oxidoreductase [Catenuloplanes nepalensis]|uniref:NADPH:quinone reductase-like Zn-dependent oxidoreductase n=1 Tax=Catenuloplanes nepalensis TaxID=587533 RepID=A0ABT9N198_9ACTN|nr:NADP-dependent oxidoreductase [Catenuloplanes nepalensis]MDP9797206.1 NADPH:quinone reductase-like Zn-dependent oxidoreductase [Catenuloplanes nepalensis]
MRAVRYGETGPSSVLHVDDDVPEPHAGPGRVRIAVVAAGVNAWDWKVRSGRAGIAVTGPRIPGGDAAGVVDEIGDGVTGVAVGDEVLGVTAGGATAEHAVLTHWARKPPELPFVTAAGLPTPAETAVRALDALGLATGETLMISGASGGVGLVAAQIARERGARVIGTAAPARHDLLRRLGVIPAAYGDGLVTRLRELAPDGVDRALDAAGHGVVPALIELTGDAARVVSIADFSAHGARVTDGGEGRSWHALGEAAALVAAGRLEVPVAATFPMAEAAAAHDLSESGHAGGRVVILVR